MDILVNKSNANGEEIIEPTRVAYTLSNYYEEILIDEYQDSNYVQETLLNSISKEKFGNPNGFVSAHDCRVSGFVVTLKAAAA